MDDPIALYSLLMRAPKTALVPHPDTGLLPLHAFVQSGKFVDITKFADHIKLHSQTYLTRKIHMEMPLCIMLRMPIRQGFLQRCVREPTILRTNSANRPSRCGRQKFAIFKKLAEHANQAATQKYPAHAFDQLFIQRANNGETLPHAAARIGKQQVG